MSPACNETIDLEALLEGNLEGSESERIERHLEACPSCAAELALARRIEAGLRSLPTLECPESVTTSVLEAARSSQQASQRSRFQSAEREKRQPWLRQAMAVAASLLVLVVGSVWLMDRPPQADYDLAEIVRAEEEARLAFAYLGAITQKAGLALRDDVIRPNLIEAPRRAFGRLGSRGSKERP